MSTALSNCLRYDKEIIHFPLRVHQLSYCPCSVGPMRPHEGACLHFTTPHHHVLILVSVDLYTFQACLSRVLVRLIEQKSLNQTICNICIIIVVSATQLLLRKDRETTMAVGLAYQLVNLTHCKKLRYCYALCPYELTWKMAE